MNDYEDDPNVIGVRSGYSLVEVVCPHCGKVHSHGYGKDMLVGPGSHRTGHCVGDRKGDYWVTVAK